MVENTYLVRILMDAGINRNRAEAFERALDDRPVCGISGTLLGSLLLKQDSKEVKRFNDMLEAYSDHMTTHTRPIPSTDFLQAFRH